MVLVQRTIPGPVPIADLIGCRWNWISLASCWINEWMPFVIGTGPVTDFFTRRVDHHSRSLRWARIIGLSPPKDALHRILRTTYQIDIWFIDIWFIAIWFVGIRLTLDCHLTAIWLPFDLPCDCHVICYFIAISLPFVWPSIHIWSICDWYLSAIWFASYRIQTNHFRIYEIASWLTSDWHLIHEHLIDWRFIDIWWYVARGVAWVLS